MNKTNRKTLIVVFIVIFIIVLVFPYVITRDNPYFYFDENCGSIGDTIGGTTAPIIGLFSIGLLIMTLFEQMKFNKEQKRLAFDEQFKSMLFTLLNDQQDIYNRIMPIRDDKGFFQSAREELKKIFEVLECEDFYTSEDDEMAAKENGMIEESLSMIGENPSADNRYMKNRKICLIYRNAKKYQISKKLYERYKKLDAKPKVACGYMIFYNKHSQAGVYFRHLYHIVKFIADTEKSEIEIFHQGRANAEVETKYKDYAQFVQARMSFDELLLLFYNSFLFEKMQDYLIRYNLLENLNVERLVRLEHNCIPEYQLKVQKTLYQSILEIVEEE